MAHPGRPRPAVRDRAGVVARRASKRGVRVVSSAGVRALGQDVTQAFVLRPTLVVAPHPDDETFGCGAAVARMRSLGTAVTVAFVSDGGSSPRPAGMPLDDMLRLRRAEAAEALGILGVEEPAVVHLGFEDGSLPEQQRQVAGALEDLVRARGPAQVLVTSSRDRHPDHAAVAAAVHAAASRRPGVFEVYEYPIWQRAPVGGVVRNVARAGTQRRPRLVATAGFLEQKRRAVAAYASQLPHLPVGFVEDFLLPFETFVPTGPGAL